MGETALGWIKDKIFPIFKVESGMLMKTDYLSSSCTFATEIYFETGQYTMIPDFVRKSDILNYLKDFQVWTPMQFVYMDYEIATCNVGLQQLNEDSLSPQPFVMIQHWTHPSPKIKL
uniref:Uncharacterized protein n=1 Tax=Romanomermis culicivorax TaxID=13658 RepID=A0A915IS13_ROMCU